MKVLLKSPSAIFFLQMMDEKYETAVRTTIIIIIKKIFKGAIYEIISPTFATKQADYLQVVN